MQKAFPYAGIEDMIPIQAFDISKIFLFSKGLSLRFPAFENQSGARALGNQMTLETCC